MTEKVKITVSAGTFVKAVLAVAATKLILDVGMRVSVPYIRRATDILQRKLDAED